MEACECARESHRQEVEQPLVESPPSRHFGRSSSLVEVRSLPRHECVSGGGSARTAKKASKEMCPFVSEASKSDTMRGLPDLGIPRIFRYDPIRADAARRPGPQQLANGRAVSVPKREASEPVKQIGRSDGD